MSPRTLLDFESRFWAKVDQSGGPDACWPWTGATIKGHCRRYGVIRGRDANGNGGRQAKQRLAHRVALEIATGLHGRGLHACHGETCLDGLCCNPLHLRWDTATGNNQDVAAKKREAKR